MESLSIKNPFPRLACRCCVWCGLFTLMGGCADNSRSVDHAEVSGKVLYEGKPLPGGQVTFVALEAGFGSSAHIDEQGKYQINAPVSEVQIGVNNEMLKSRAPGKPKETLHPKEPNSEPEMPIKGRWVRIPFSYADPATSGLKYTVKPGSQTHNIELSNKPIPPPGVAGP